MTHLVINQKQKPVLRLQDTCYSKNKHTTIGTYMYVYAHTYTSKILENNLSIN